MENIEIAFQPRKYFEVIFGLCRWLKIDQWHCNKVGHIAEISKNYNLTPKFMKIMVLTQLHISRPLDPLVG